MNYIIAGLLGVAITFSCISLYFIRRAMRNLEEAKKNLKSFKKPEKRKTKND